MQRDAEWMPEPKWIAWELTGRCNLGCIHCRSSSDMELASGECSTDEGRALLDEIASSYSPVVVLTGGEPLLRHDWFELASYGTRKKLRMCLATNGTLVDEQVCADILKAGIRMVSISLDGSTEATHDDFRRQPGAFQGAMLAIEHFHRHKIPFLINSSFTKRNQHDIQATFRLARSLGAEAWYLFMIVPTGRGEEVMDELISSQDYEEILRWHYGQEREETSILMRPTCAPHYYRIARECSREQGSAWNPRSLKFSTGVGKGCLAGQHIAFIDRLGELRPCSYFPESAGNVRIQGFRKVWEGAPLLNALRDYSRYEGKCGACEYVRVCGGCRARAAAYNRGNSLAEEPFCGHVPRDRKADGAERGHMESAQVVAADAP